MAWAVQPHHVDPELGLGRSVLQNPTEANNSQVSEAAFPVSKVEGRNTFSFTASRLDL